ncbi:MAG: GAF domain [Phormidesmis priestleyi Ana]|uniref:GAF domain n=1 Tax=Phormidesmis priestleyi Ana TaxID=1666911 RepID=A0A0N8KM70_9CYAN|nr:MAG: GAF domain [Phormidesmis priestleyi Ana]
MTTPFDPDLHLKQDISEVSQIQTIVRRLHEKMQRDATVQNTTDSLRNFLQVDRVVLYYFYQQWKGRVTFESLSNQKFSILGSTGPDECFNGEYAAMYLEGRVRAIADIETELIAPCHRDFLRDIQVRANLVVPILTAKGLWGLLVAHHCQSLKQWTETDITQMQQGALTLASAPSIKEN